MSETIYTRKAVTNFPRLDVDISVVSADEAWNEIMSLATDKRWKVENSVTNRIKYVLYYGTGFYYTAITFTVSTNEFSDHTVKKPDRVTNTALLV